MLPPDTQLNLLEQLRDNAHTCREQLRLGVQDCLESLREVSQLEYPSTSTLAARYQAVLFKLALALFKATRPFLSQEWNNGRLNFYFWPGYESLLMREGGNARLTLTEKTTMDRVVPCGVGWFLNDGKPESYLASNTSIWFERALTKCTSHEDHATFIPGSTHAWISQNDLRTRAGGISNGEGFLTALEISLNGGESTALQRGIYSINLDERQFENWALRIATELNGKSLNRSIPWPTPLDGFYRNEDKIDQKIRLDLYNIWLAACFGLNWPDEWRNKVFDILYTKNLGCLVDRLNVPKDDTVDKTPACRRWYTLRLEKTIESNGVPQSLGSAMFLCSARLDPVYLYIASSFVNEMYFRMRDLENNIQARNQGQREREIKVLQKYKGLAHELSQSLRLAVNVYHRIARELMPAPTDLLNLYVAPHEYIPNTTRPFFNDRFQFRHDWFLYQLKPDSSGSSATQAASFVTQMACILLSYLGEPALVRINEEWLGSNSELTERLLHIVKNRRHELGVFDQLFGPTISKLVGEDSSSTWTKQDVNAFQCVLKGAFHYPFKNQKLTGPLLGLWLLERRADLDLGDKEKTWLFGPSHISGHQWPALQALQALHALYQEVIRNQQCGLAVKTIETGELLSGIDIELSSCNDEVFSKVAEFVERGTHPEGGLATAITMAKDAELSIRTYPKGNVIVLGFSIG